jgi:hypothetical protein
VTLNVGEVPAINVTLKPAGAQETVVITPGEVLSVDTNTSQISGVINERTLTNLPLNGRNFLDLAFLIPGNAPAPNYDPTKTTTIEVSSAGQLGRGGNIAVDGADNNNDVVGGTLQNFPQDGIGEFQIATNRFSAEIGRSASSAINIVTKSGGNDFHGAGAFYYRNSRLSSVLPTLDRSLVQTSGRPPFDREQYAASIGGPIRRGRAWFFAAFEYRNQDGVVITGVRDLAARRVVTSFSPAPLNDLLFTGRGDWQVGKNDRMAFRYSDQREDDVIAAVCGGLSVRQTTDSTRSTGTTPSSTTGRTPSHRPYSTTSSFTKTIFSIASPRLSRIRMRSASHPCRTVATSASRSRRRLQASGSVSTFWTKTSVRLTCSNSTSASNASSHAI